jgi:hypothetical protein
LYVCVGNKIHFSCEKGPDTLARMFHPVA